LPRLEERVGQPWRRMEASRVRFGCRMLSGRISLEGGRMERIVASRVLRWGSVQGSEVVPPWEERSSVLSSRSIVRGMWLGWASDQVLSWVRHSVRVCSAC